MKKFAYTIQEANGVHARPAGLLVKAAKALDSTITLETAAGRSAAATRLMAVMGLGIKQGDTVTVKHRRHGEVLQRESVNEKRPPIAPSDAVGGRFL